MQDFSFAQRLKQVIEADPDLTVAGLAVRAGLDNSALRSLLSGRVKSPRLDTAIRVCNALGTTLEDFMSGRFPNPEDAQNSEEQRIRALLSELSLKERQLLITYAEGLRDASQSAPDEPE